jgi:DNA-binding PadR family transcriptional regulator
MADTDVDDLLPLPPVTFHVLVSLAERPRHGYSILQEVAERTDNQVKLHAGTLYATIKRLLSEGLIKELSRRPAGESEDERRRYYELTPFGRRVAIAEANRLTALVRQARASGLAFEAE